MKQSLTIFAVIALSTVSAFAQSAPALAQLAGFTAPPAGRCADASNVGSTYNQLGNPSNGFVGLYNCQQTGASGLGTPSYGWVPLAMQPSTGTTGTISVANGKAAVVSNSLTLAGTDSTTMTFPTTSATIARTDAANTFTGTQTFGAVVATGITGLTGVTTPNAAGGTTIGSAALPFSSVYVGGAATNNFQLTGTATAARVVTFPDATLTVPGTVQQFCGTTSTCSATNISTAAKIVSGQAPLVSGTPSTVTITGFSPAFTSTTSYACSVTDMTTATNNLLKVANTSASSITITGPNTLTDTIAYLCVGN